MSSLIRPALSGDRFLADVGHARAEAERLHVWWLGQSGFLVQWEGRHILLDPYLSDSLSVKYHGTDKPHTRMTGLVVEPRRLDFVEVVTSSHNHTDHLDAETLNPLRAVNAGLQLVIPEANRAFVAERLGCDATWPVGLDAGRSVTVSGFTFTGMPAAHEKLDRDDLGRHRYLGYIVEIGPWSIYHSGDTVLFSGMGELLRRFEIDVAILPINGTAPERRVAGNLNGAEAAELAKEIGAGCVVPCHYDMFDFNTATTALFESRAEELGQPFRVLKNGARLSLEPS